MNNNILEFFIKMRDLSGPAVVKTIENVRKIERTADMASRSIQGVTERTRSLGRTDPSSGPVSGLQRIRQEAEKTNATLEKTAGSGRSGSGGGLLGKLGRGFAISTALIGALSFGKSAVGSAMNYEATSKSYEVLTGSKAKGSGLASDLNRLQQNTILGPEVFKSGQTLLGFGVAADKVLPSIKMLGDVAMGDAERFNSLTLAFAQMTAAGRLQGQDLLQFVNAGFNPLLVISKQTGKSMMELRKQMEAGAISSQMVTKAFQDATGKGGQFNNMMEVMGETTKGKMAQLSGSFEAMKIAVGERLSPAVGNLAGWFTELCGTVKDWFEIPVQQKIMQEQQGVIGLVSVITKLNEGNDTRKKLLGELVAKYPDLFGNIDIEKIKNSELLKTLNDVNAAYEKRIGIAVSEKLLGDDKKSAADQWKKYVENSTSAELTRRQLESTDAKSPFAATLQRRLQRQTERAQTALSNFQSYQGQADVEDKVLRMKKIMAFAADPNQLSTIKDAGDKTKFLSNVALYKSKGLGGFKGWDTLDMMEKMMAGTVTPPDGSGGGGTGGGKGGGSVAGGITGGGPRVINISGVNMKIADTVNVNAIDSKDFLDKMEPQAENMFLRILNSGASVQ